MLRLEMLSQGLPCGQANSALLASVIFDFEMNVSLVELHVFLLVEGFSTFIAGMVFPLQVDSFNVRFQNGL